MFKRAATAAYGIAAPLSVAAALATSSLGLAAEPDEWESITDERLLNPEPGDCLSYRRTYDVTGFSPLRQINRRNIAQLRPVWSYTVRDNRRWARFPQGLPQGTSYTLTTSLSPPIMPYDLVFDLRELKAQGERAPRETTASER
jgi:hypothetical protein